MATLYEDCHVICDDDGLTIHRDYFPFLGDKRVPYSQIRRARNARWGHSQASGASGGWASPRTGFTSMAVGRRRTGASLSTSVAPFVPWSRPTMSTPHPPEPASNGGCPYGGSTLPSCASVPASVTSSPASGVALSIEPTSGAIASAGAP
jgi:hypothetical protein